MATAKEFRDFCQTLIRDRVKSRVARQELADSLGLSVSAVEAMTYRGVGSFETFVGALVFLCQADLDSLKKIILDRREPARRSRPTRESDKLWYELDLELTEEEKIYWVSMIRAASQIHLTIAKRRNSARRARSAR